MTQAPTSHCRLCHATETYGVRFRLKQAFEVQLFACTKHLRATVVFGAENGWQFLEVAGEARPAGAYRTASISRDCSLVLDGVATEAASA